MSRIWIWSALFVSLFAGGTSAAFSWVEHQSDLEALKSDTLMMFDETFASKKAEARFVDPVLRVRDGFELFCIQEDLSATTRASMLVKDVSEAFRLDLKLTLTNDLAKCPLEETTFYILQGERPETAKMVSLMDRVVGGVPSEPDKVFLDWAHGYSISLPGPGYREFAFSSSYAGVPDHVVKSILVEEMTHAILRADDVPTDKIVSILGEDLSVIDYVHWFVKNPEGYCSVDILLMELLLGPSTAHLETMGEMRTYIETDFRKLFRAAKKRARDLDYYADSRCWAWTIW